MRNLLVSFFLLLLLAPLTAAGDKARPTFEDRLQGTWTADNAPNRLLSRLVIARADEGWVLETWAVRGLKEELIHKTPLHLLRADTGKGPVGRALAVWNEGSGEGETTLYGTLHFQESDLVLDLAKVYRAATHPNWFGSYALKKAIR